MLSDSFFPLLFFLVSGLLLRPIRQFLLRHNVTAPNFQGNRIPHAMGLFLWLLCLLYLFMSAYYPFSGASGRGLTAAQSAGTDRDLPIAVFFAAVTAVFFAGWFDDLIGEKRIKGFTGHFRALREGVITSGVLKVVIVGMTAVWLVSYLPGGMPAKACAVLEIALMTNLLNLLDLRPGRALKAFFALVFVLLAAGVTHVWAGWLLPLVCGGIWLMPHDLRAKSMLGDAGANMLGFAAGCAFVWSAPAWLNTGAVVALIVLHWVAERGSLTRIIDQNRLLRWLDRLGRA
ncbi:MAG TPA: hypothetical protein VF260_02685 [Bacilli bacterium]